MSANTTSGDGKNFRLRLAEYIRNQARPIDKFGHQPRLYALAERVGDGRSYDDDVVYAAAWLHDLGVFVGHRPEGREELAQWDNVRYAIEQAPAVLRRVGFPQGKIPSVVEAIRTHQPQQTPQTLEGRILRDADILEQLGAIGILRVAAKIGRDTRYAVFGDAAATFSGKLWPNCRANSAWKAPKSWPSRGSRCFGPSLKNWRRRRREVSFEATLRAAAGVELQKAARGYPSKVQDRA